MIIEHFFHAGTGTLTYLVHDGSSGVVIDPVADYVGAAGRLSFESCDRVLAAASAAGVRLEWILETHAHADHLSGGDYMRRQTGARLGVGAGIQAVQQAFKPVFDLPDQFPTDGSQFDRLFADGDVLNAGAMTINVLHTPGHTSDSVTYLTGDAAFIGDTLFRPELGTARCDFPGGVAALLFASIQKLFALPDATRLYLCHDYPADGGEASVWVSVEEQRQHNVHVRAGTSESQFVKLRQARDATLAMPALIIPAIQVNIGGGALPAAADNGTHYLKVPVNRL